MAGRIDMHMHTIFSDDGQYQPEQLVAMCAAAGLEVIAIADHDTAAGVARAQDAARAVGLTLITGIEIDCRYQDVDLHVLGYGINPCDPAFATIGQDIADQERSCSQNKIRLTEALGLTVDRKRLAALAPNGVYTGELFAEVLLSDGRNDGCRLLDPYRPGGSRSDNPYVNFYWDFYSQGRPCHTPISYIPLTDAIAAITAAGGISVLAHPGNNLKGRFELFDRMVPLGLKGVEAFSSYHDAATCAYFLAKARQYDLLASCGSDFHGKTKPAIKLGHTGCTLSDAQMRADLSRCGLLRQGGDSI